MRHRVAHRKLRRTSEHRKALLRNLCTSLIAEGKLVTTLAKAKELRPFAERAITLAKRGLSSDTPEKALSYRRLAAGYFAGGRAEVRFRAQGSKDKRVVERTGGPHALKRLFDEVGPRYLERAGGYTRIVKLGWRKGDGSDLALIELVEGSVEKSEKKEEKAAKK
jgi:large subunit ribosomal protein L17